MFKGLKLKQKQQKNYSAQLNPCAMALALKKQLSDLGCSSRTLLNLPPLHGGVV